MIIESKTTILNLKKLGFINVKKGAAHCLIYPQKKEILCAYSWSEYVKKCTEFLR